MLSKHSLFFIGIFVTGFHLGYSSISCSFEQNFCDWSSVNPKFPWRRRSGPTEDSISGPRGDHTSSKGYYVYVRSSDSDSNTTVAILQSKSIEIKEPTTFSFWLFMNGVGIGDFSLKYHPPDNMDILLFRRIGRQDYNWTSERVVLPPGVFKLQFEATCKLRYGGDLAIDDIVLSSEHEVRPNASTTPASSYTIRLQDSCSFENGMCGWVSSNTVDNKPQWQLQSGGNTQLHINGAHGGNKYCYTRSRQKTTLTSQLLKFTGGIRVQFSYILPSSSHSSKLSLSLLEWVTSSISTRKEIWHTQQSTTAWKTITVYATSRDYTQLQFTSTNGTTITVIGLDDIEVSGAPENSSNDTETLFSCSFENSYCGIKEDPSIKHDPDLDWKLSVKSGVHGHYLYYDERNCTGSETAGAVLPQIKTNTNIACLSFEYITSAYSVLQIEQKNGDSPGRYIWTDSSSTEGSWTSVSTTITIFNTSRFSFQATCNQQIKWTAIDSVKIMKGACNKGIHMPGEYSCSFDRNMCGFTNNAANNFTNWSRGTTSAWPTQDHTTGIGQYLFLQSPATMKRKTAQLISPVFHTTEPQCILFAVQIFGKSKQVVSVYIKLTNSNDPSKLVWRLSKDVSPWHQAEIQAPMLQYQIVIEGSEYGCCDGLITLDDFKIANGACKENPFCSSSSCQHGGTCVESLDTFECICPAGYSGTTCGHEEIQTGAVVFKCDFESGQGMCGFTQQPSVKSDNSLMWIRTHGYPHAHGYYAAYYEDGRHNGSQAVLTSPYLPSNTTNLCLSFRYVSHKANVLQIASDEGLPTTKVLWQGADTNGTWKEIYITIIVLSEFKISFVATATGLSQMVAIDDVKLTNKACSGGSKLMDGFKCSFDQSMCGFTQNMKNGYSKWTVGRGSDGPSKDHTTGSGRYFYLQSSVKNEEKKAQLISPVFPASPEPTCVLFSLQVFETSYAELNVYIQPVNSSKVQSSWKRSRETSSWSQAQVPVYQPNKGYQVIIEASEHGCCSGVITVDDFEMSSDACKDTFFCVAAVCHNGGTCVKSLNGEVECICLPRYSGIYCQHKIAEDESDVFYHCDFESGIDNCRFIQQPSIKAVKQLMWKLSSNLIPAGHGYFASFKGSPKLAGSEAVLTSPQLNRTMGDICLSFRYNSAESNSLQLLLKQGLSSAKPIWRAYKTEFWNEAYIDLKAAENFMISFVALCNGESSQVAIDDIILTNTSCSSKKKKVPTATLR